MAKQINRELVINFIHWLDYDKNCLFEEYHSTSVKSLRKSDRICDQMIAEILEALGFKSMLELIKSPNIPVPKEMLERVKKAGKELSLKNRKTT